MAVDFDGKYGLRRLDASVNDNELDVIWLNLAHLLNLTLRNLT